MNHISLNIDKVSKQFLLLAILLVLFSLVGFAQNIKVKNYYKGNRILKEEFFVKDAKSNILDGQYIAYFSDGKIKTKGDYVNNKPVGIWEYYFESGALKMKGEMQDEGAGMWVYFFEKGNKNMEGRLRNGKRDGNWRFYYEYGGLKSVGNFEEGKRIGKWLYYNENTTLKAEAEYKNNRGYYTRHYESGAVKAKGLNVDGKSDSTWVYFHENKHQKATGNYEQGIKEGLWKYYHENGTLASEGEYLAGIENGKWIFYHENGQVSSEGIEKEGKKDGFWKMYHRNGEFKGESAFVAGEGDYKEYYESGKLKIEGHIKEGRNQGEWLYYYEDGSLEGEAEYMDGIGAFKGYYVSGKLRMKGTIEDGVNTGVWELYKESGELAGYYTTVYEKGKPRYEPMGAAENVEKKSVFNRIPAFLFKNKKVKYFNSKVNEFEGFIVATNPVAMVVGFLPFSAEYYMQERLGYELLFTYVRDPFFSSDSSVPLRKVYDRGFTFQFRQKFYQKDEPFGMLYFGQEFAFTSIDHFANVQDMQILGTTTSIRAKEYRYEYGVFIGDRLMKFAGKSGITLDAFVGIGIGYRIYSEKFKPNDIYSSVFEEVKKSKLSMPIRFGLNIGYAFKFQKNL